MDKKRLLMSSIGLSRGAIGVAAFLAPRELQRRGGLKPADNPQASYIVRIAGIRDLGLAAGVLTASPQERRRWALIALGCDLGDSIAGVAGLAGGYLDRRTSAILTGTAVLAVVLGAVSLD